VGFLSPHRASKSRTQERYSRSHNLISHVCHIGSADDRMYTRLGKYAVQWMLQHFPRKSVKLLWSPYRVHSTQRCEDVQRALLVDKWLLEAPCFLGRDSGWRRVLSLFHASSTLLAWVDPPGPQSLWTQRWRSRRYLLVVYWHFKLLRWHSVEL
jgi:hypothetical protein